MRKLVAFEEHVAPAIRAEMEPGLISAVGHASVNLVCGAADARCLR